MTAHASAEKSLPVMTKQIRWDIPICVFLGVLFWIVRYWQFIGYGLYEDDLTIVPQAISMNFTQLFRYIANYIVNLYGHGRPLSDSFIYLFSNLGWRMDKLQGIYIIGYFLTLINIVLFYALIRRVANRNIALIASIIYILSAADTTQVFLTHSLGVQPSITLVLVAFHAYLSNHKVVAYLFSAIVLFSYETPFLVFLGAPLLQQKWGHPIIKKFLIHACILFGMLVAVYLLRTQIGEGRVSDLSTQQLLLSPITHSVIGPVVNLGTYLLRPYQVIRGANTTMIIAFVLSALLLFILFYLLKWGINADIKGLVSSLRMRSRWAEIPEEIQNLGKLFLAGAVMLISAYPLTFTVRAYAISGRDTRVHLAGVMGASIVVASIVALLFILLREKRMGWILPLLVSVWAASLVSFGFMIQQDYRLAWQLQREFWTSMVQIIPDAGHNTVVLVSPDGLQDVRQIGANTWNLPRILNQLYALPAEWKDPPRVYRLVPNWEDNIIAANGNFLINVNTVTAPPSLYGDVPSVQVIFIDSSSGKLVRRNQPLTIATKSYPLKPVGRPLLEGLDKEILYSLLIEDSRIP